MQRRYVLSSEAYGGGGAEVAHICHGRALYKVERLGNQAEALVTPLSRAQQRRVDRYRDHDSP